MTTHKTDWNNSANKGNTQQVTTVSCKN